MWVVPFLSGMPGLVVSPAFWPGIGCLFAGEGGCLPVRTDEPGLFDPVGDRHLYVFDLGYPCPEVREYRAEQIDLGNGALIGTFRFHVPLPASCGPMVFKESLKNPRNMQRSGDSFCVSESVYFAKPLPMPRKSSALRAAPPIRPPSTSSLAKISAAFEGLHEPP